MKSTRSITLALAAIMGVAFAAMAQAPATSPTSERVKTTPPEAGWTDRLDKTDRAILDEALGYAPPPIPADLKWIEGQPVAWNQLRGKVVVVQSITTASPAGRSWTGRLKKVAAEFKPEDLYVFAVHTPEGAAEAAEYIGRKNKDVPVALDSTGAFCDALGFYKRPTNLVIDRQGVVRYAGLNERGLEGAIKLLVAESFDPTKAAPARPGAETAAAAPDSKKAEFPKPEGKIAIANDLRGKRAPDFFVQEWITSEPTNTNRTLVMDFWATWCGPCVAAIPHMNELAGKFGDRAAFVGISDEKEADFEIGLNKRKLKLDSFRYSLALDSSSKMYSKFGIRAIPHVVVVSSDWIVRWQGHPSDLNAMVLERIIKADEALRAADSDKETKSKPTNNDAPNRNRWTSN